MVNLGKFVTITAWLLVGLLMSSAWVVGLLVSWEIGVLLAFTGCAMSAVAAVLHIRCFTVRVVAVVRAVGLRAQDDSVPVHRIH